MAEPDFQFNLEEALEQPPKVMLRNPFAQNVEGDYFASDERNQQLALLEHLSRYSNLLSVVIGPQGSGKTRFLQEFARLQDESAIVVRLQATMLMTAGQLLQSIYAAFAGKITLSDANVTSFSPLLAYASEVEGRGQKAIILIDNAQELNTDAVSMLMDLMSLATESQAVPHVALFSEHPLNRNLDNYQRSRYEQLSHQLELAPFSFEQTRAYLLHRVRAIGGGINLPFNERQIKKIHQSSGGLPGAINAVAASLLGVGNKDKEGATKGEKTRWLGGLTSGFPTVHLALMSTIMMGILLAVIFYEPTPEAPAPSTSVAPIAKAPRQASSETLARIEAMQRQIGQQGQLALPPIPTGAAQPSTPTPTEPVAVTAPVIQPAPVRTAPVVTTPAPTAPAVVTTPTPVTPEPAPSAMARFNKTDAWLKENPNRYTLQLLGTYNIGTVEDFIREQGSIDAFSYFKARHNNREWFVVVYGTYRNRSEAIAAVEQLPADLRALNPWARSVRGIQDDIRKAQ